MPLKTAAGKGKCACKVGDWQAEQGCCANKTPTALELVQKHHVANTHLATNGLCIAEWGKRPNETDHKPRWAQKYTCKRMTALRASAPHVQGKACTRSNLPRPARANWIMAWVCARMLPPTFRSTTDGFQSPAYHLADYHFPHLVVPTRPQILKPQRAEATRDSRDSDQLRSHPREPHSLHSSSFIHAPAAFHSIYVGCPNIPRLSGTSLWQRRTFSSKHL